MYPIIYYDTSGGKVPVKDIMLSLDKKVFKKVNAVMLLLRERGANLHRPYSDHVRGKIRELRIQFAHNSVRILYFFVIENNIVLLHGFLKKDQKLKESDISLAETRMQDWIKRYGGAL